MEREFKRYHQARGRPYVTDQPISSNRRKPDPCAFVIFVGNTSDARLENASGGKPAKLDYLSSTALPAKTAQAVPAQQLQATGSVAAKVHITSAPSGGEIYVDTKFFGNTPSHITMSPGEHVVRITLGAREWTRTVQITPGEIQLRAEFP